MNSTLGENEVAFATTMARIWDHSLPGGVHDLVNATAAIPWLLASVWVMIWCRAVLCSKGSARWPWSVTQVLDRSVGGIKHMNPAAAAS